MITLQDAQQIAQTDFGIDGQLTRLAGEYDDNFHIKTTDGTEFLLKIAHEKEAGNIIDLQNAALQYLASSPQSFYFPHLIPTLTNTLYTSKHPCARLFTFVSGKLYADVRHSNELLQSLGTQLGKLTLALSHFKHPAAARYLKWDLKQAAWLGQQLDVISNAEDRACVNYFLEKFTTEAAPQLSLLRQSIIHGDVNDHNIIVNDERVSGFIDFGDIVETATICELAIALAYALLDQADPLTAAPHIIKNYHAVFPLEEREIAILFPLICIRLCMSVVNSAIRKQEKPDDTYLTITEKPAWAMLKKCRALNFSEVTAHLRSACYASKQQLQQARQKLLGKNVGLSYQEPLHIVRGAGQYLYDETGRQYLDCVNNVAHVGHCHPRVVAAGQQQMAILNTNTRYLHENLTRYAERLLATFPDPLNVCFFVCSGSEANELALRLACTHTQRKNFLVMDHAYHGNTSTLINISPYKFNGPGGQGQADFVEVLPLPAPKQNLQQLLAAGVTNNTAAFICESCISCGGQIVLPAHYLQQVYAAIRQIGGVCIADEVQVGLGRVGTDFWGFATQEVVPDIVTLGKPLGNGHPLAAVITTREIADSFCNGMEYFNTFGGNPVSCAIGLAVLDVLAEENLQANALLVGNHLQQKLTSLKTKHAVIKDVRGLGLFLGIELACHGKLASQIVNQMKDRGILLSTDGPLQNVIKIKPPLVFTKENGDLLVQHLDEVLVNY